MRKIICPTAMALLITCTFACAADPPFPTFKADEIDKTLTVGYSLLLVDLNGDKKPDVVVADSRRVIWFENPATRGGKWKLHTILAGRTVPDNVAIAPIDINGDGQTDLVLGAGWKGYNTKDNSTLQWLSRGDDVTEPWTLHPIDFSEVALHRIHVADLNGDGHPQVIVAPLLGRGATQQENWGQSTPAIVSYAIPPNPAQRDWKPQLITNQFHVTHNFWPVDWDGSGKLSLLVACYEGVWLLQRDASGQWKPTQVGAGEQAHPDKSRGSSEVKLGHTKSGQRFIATIEPWHGNEMVVYTPPASGQGLWDRKVLDAGLAEGHGIWLADLEGNGGDDIIACARAGKPGEGRGVFVYSPQSPGANAGAPPWEKHVIDDQDMAAEDLAAADLDGDGKIDIVAVGRATHNVRIYWNQGAGGRRAD